MGEKARQHKLLTPVDQRNQRRDNEATRFQTTPRKAKKQGRKQRHGFRKPRNQLLDGGSG
jgi:hypothetical protein